MEERARRMGRRLEGDDISRVFEGPAFDGGAPKTPGPNVVDANAALSKRGFLFST